MTMNNNAKRLLTLPIMIGMIIAGAVPVTTQQAQARKQEDPEKYFRSPNTLHGKTVLIPIGSHIEGRMNQTLGSCEGGIDGLCVAEIPLETGVVSVVIPNRHRAGSA